MTFLYDHGKQYSYDDLLAALNATNSYCPLLKTDNLFRFFVNLIKALTAGQPLTLLDADLNANEIDGVDETLVNKAVSIDAPQLATMDDVVAALQQSPSLITIFTSGTTGQPKKVIHHISSLTRQVRLGDRYHGQVWAYAYNPTHMAGLQVFFQAFENLNTLVNVFGAPRAVVYDLIGRLGITHISATPTFYRLLLPVENSYNTVVRVTLGGEKSDTKLYDAIHEIFPEAKINNVYASTEAGSLFAARGDAFLIPEGIRDKFKVVDDELLIHRSLLGESDSFTFDGDYYHSGDLIEWLDQEKGLFRFKSRKNELINVGGYKVNPEEVENEILAISGVKEALVYGKRNSILGNVLCADVVLEPAVILTEVDIKRTMAKQMQDFKIPRRIKFVDHLELTRTGKKKR